MRFLFNFTGCNLMETYVPIKNGGQNYWTRFKIKRNEVGGIINKDLEVENNRLLNLNIEPWLEDISVLEAPPNYNPSTSSSQITYQIPHMKPIPALGFINYNEGSNKALLLL